MERKAYPSDVRDDEWAFVAPYLTLRREDAPQREHDLREVFNGPRYIVRTGAPWRMMPNDLPPWHTVYQQTQRWIEAGVFEAIVHDLRELLRLASGRKAQPSAAIFDARTIQSTPESGGDAGHDFVAWVVAPANPYRAVMPSTVRLSPTHLVSPLPVACWLASVLMPEQPGAKHRCCAQTITRGKRMLTLAILACAGARMGCWSPSTTGLLRRIPISISPLPSGCLNYRNG